MILWLFNFHESAQTHFRNYFLAQVLSSSHLKILFHVISILLMTCTRDFRFYIRSMIFYSANNFRRQSQKEAGNN